MTQINTPYPATAYLTGFLRSQGVETVQEDPALSLLLRMLSKQGLRDIKSRVKDQTASKAVRHFLYHYEGYETTIEAVVRFLQGNDPTLAYRIIHEGFIPRGPRFKNMPLLGEAGDGLDWAFGSLGLQDRAQYFASLYIDDLADVIREGIDPRFELSRYAEKLAASAPSFDPLLESLNSSPTLVDEYLDQITRELFEKHQPTVIGLTIPFPGNVYGAFRMAKELKRIAPALKILIGGGYVNTELRNLKDPRVFDFVDFVTFDDGERPILGVLENIRSQDDAHLLRTMVRENGGIVFKSNTKLHDIPFKDTPAPVYDGLPIDKYLSLCELPNPMHRLWSDGRWNKLTVAHGCYWKKCSFCDINLDYIGRYEPQTGTAIAERIETLIKETGQSGFHFVDEAAPPKSLVAMANSVLEKNLTITWWGNIRFENAFTPEVARLLSRSGCVAMSGGLEVASDRLLKLMEKGVTVEQVARVTKAFSDAGIMVHAYLMFGFPTQTLQETIDSLERVRQLFEEGCIQSAFWHRFSATVHSPVGKNPEKYGIKIEKTPSTFAENDLAFTDPTGVDHDALHPGLKKALYNYMHGMGLDADVRNWFDFPVPKTKVPRNLIRGFLKTPATSREQHAH